MIILKVTIMQVFTLSLQDTFLEKPQGGQVDPPQPFFVNRIEEIIYIYQETREKAGKWIQWVCPEAVSLAKRYLVMKRTHHVFVDNRWTGTPFLEKHQRNTGKTHSLMLHFLKWNLVSFKKRDHIMKVSGSSSTLLLSIIKTSELNQCLIEI